MKTSLIFTLTVFLLISLNIMFFPLESDARNIERVSVNNSGVQGDDYSGDPSISSDGRYVAFSSYATNLVTGDTNASSDVFVYDRNTDTIERISVDDSDVQGDNDSSSPGISSDGRYVAFYSSATNLVTGDTNGRADVFVYDRDAIAPQESIERVSVDNSGVQGDGHSLSPGISSDGRYVAFHSYATNLVTGDTNARSDVFVYDRDAIAPQESIERVSVNNSGVQGDDSSSSPSISSDGRYVAFYSSATNLVTGDTNGQSDVFVYDRDAIAPQESIERVSVDNSGVQGDNSSSSPSISSDGRYVAFHSYATNLVTGDTNASPDVFVYDRDAIAPQESIERVSVDDSGVQVDGDSLSPSISSDGRYVAFYSDATNLVTGDTNGQDDVFVYDRDTNAIERVSVDGSGVQGDDSSYEPSISSDGRYVAFSSEVANLVTGDTNGQEDVFVSYTASDTSSPPGGGGSGGCFISTCRTLE